jgi:hypothetical protein
MSEAKDHLDRVFVRLHVPVLPHLVAQHLNRFLDPAQPAQTFQPGVPVSDVNSESGFNDTGEDLDGFRVSASVSASVGHDANACIVERS